MGSTWQPLCFIRLQLLLIRVQRAQIGVFESCPAPQPVLLLWVLLELLWVSGVALYLLQDVSGLPKILVLGWV